MTKKMRLDSGHVVSPNDVAQEKLPVSEVGGAAENRHHDRVMVSTEHVLRKHRATFAALAKAVIPEPS